MPDQVHIDQLDRAIDTLLEGGKATGTLEEVAAQLLLAPDEHFKNRLKSELERNATMTVIAPVREGFRTVTPYITLAEGDRFIHFLKAVFGAEETERHVSGPGQFHAELRIGDSMLMIGSGEHARGKEKPTSLHIFVDDADAMYERAIAAGGTSLGEPADRPYGERSGFVLDPFGNRLFIARRFASHPAPEGAGSVMPYIYPPKVRPYIEFLKRAFGAQQVAIVEHGGRVFHASVRIGDAIIEMGEPDDKDVAASAFFMYVPDVDRAYERAVDAGAKSLRPPTNQPYGHRDAALLDGAGYTWYPATLL